ncbi:MAG: PQQ-dependent sugar dehydrogenase [Bacteroidota bacterium]|jgi:glucose/arabinose dehydrogenase
MKHPWRNFFGFLPIILATLTAKAQNPTDTIGNTPVVIRTAIDSSHFLNGNPSQYNYGSGPWGLTWAPDQKLWIANKKQINRYDPSTSTLDTVLTITSGYIMDVAIHPQFPSTPFVYATIDTGNYYAASAFIHLYRFTWDATSQSLMSPQVLLGWGHGGEHSGGRVIFGLDGKVYVSTAEYYQPFDSLFNNSGKILRVNPDGTVPIDNPFQDYTYTRGHRNPQGLVQIPNGQIFSSEHGQMMGNDELNRIEAGGNYGWILYDAYQCIGNQDTCQFYFSTRKFPINNGAHPPSGIDYYSHPSIPEFNGILMAVTGTNQGLYALGLNANMDSTISKNRYLYAVGPNGLPGTMSKFGRIRDVCATPYGSVFFIARDRGYPRIMEIFNPLFSNLAPKPEFEDLSVFPNPSTYSSEICIKRPISDTDFVKVFDASGRIFYEAPFHELTHTIPANTLSPGTYTIETMRYRSPKLIVFE